MKSFSCATPWRTVGCSGSIHASLALETGVSRLPTFCTTWGDSKNDKALGRQQFFHDYLPQPSNKDGGRGGRGLTVVLGRTRGCMDHGILKLWTPGYLEPTFLLSSASLPNLIIVGMLGSAWACVKSADDCGSWFSPSIMRTPRMELGSSGLAASILPTELSCWPRKFHPNIRLQIHADLGIKPAFEDPSLLYGLWDLSPYVWMGLSRGGHRNAL